jgi:hypothetical protein
MDLVIGRLLLATCLAASVVGKLREGPESFRAAMRRFGLVPPRHERAVTGSLLVLEAAAVMALLSPAYIIGACISALLGGAFAWAVSHVLARGGHFPCHCFGSLFDLRVSAWLLGLDLLIISGSVFLGVEYMGLGWFEPRVLDLALITSVVLVAGLTAQWLRVRVVDSRGGPVGLSGLPPGSPVPELPPTDLHREREVLARLRGGTVLLLFMSNDCPLCGPILDAVSVSAYPDHRWELLVAFREDEPTVRETLSRVSLPVDRVLLSASWVYRLFEIPGTPAAVEVSGGVVRRTILPLGPVDFHDVCSGLSSGG